MNGKGSARRPGTLPEGAWERIFNRNKAMTDTEEEPPKPDPSIVRKLLDIEHPFGPDQAGEFLPTDDGPAQDRDNEQED